MKKRMAKFSASLFCKRFDGMTLAHLVQALAVACGFLSTDMLRLGYKIPASVYSACERLLKHAALPLKKKGAKAMSARAYTMLVNAVGQNSTHYGVEKETAVWNFLLKTAKESAKGKGPDAKAARQALKEIVKAHKTWAGEIPDLEPTLPEFVKARKA